MITCPQVPAQRICLILLALSLTQGLWPQTTPDPSRESSADESVTKESMPQPQLRQRPATWKQLVPNIAKDQKHIWTFPFRIGQGNNWAPALGVWRLRSGWLPPILIRLLTSGAQRPFTGSTR